VQEFDQQIALPGAVPQKRADLGQRGIVKLAALGRAPSLAAPGFPDATRIIGLVERCHAYPFRALSRIPVIAA